MRDRISEIIGKAIDEDKEGNIDEGIGDKWWTPNFG